MDLVTARYSKRAAGAGLNRITTSFLQHLETGKSRGQFTPSAPATIPTVWCGLCPAYLPKNPPPKKHARKGHSPFLRLFRASFTTESHTSSPSAHMPANVTPAARG